MICQLVTTQYLTEITVIISFNSVQLVPILCTITLHLVEHQSHQSQGYGQYRSKKAPENRKSNETA